MSFFLSAFLSVVTGSFLLSILFFLVFSFLCFLFFFGSVQQIKLAIRQFLGELKYCLSYRIVSYRIVAFICNLATIILGLVSILAVVIR